MRLKDDVYWCESGGRAVFLDVQADRYFCLPKAANDAFLALAEGASPPSGQSPLHMLEERGYLIPTAVAQAISRPPSIEPATHDFQLDAPSGAGLFGICSAILIELRATLELRSYSFRQVIKMAACRASRCGQGRTNDRRTVQRIVAAANAASFLIRSHDRCLVRALAVHALCTRRGIRPKMVFGVIAHPFAAHCWVQLVNEVLVGDYEQTRLYAPILVIE